MPAVRYTVVVKAAPPSQPTTDPDICVEFYRSGHFIEMRAYFSNDHELLGQRVSEWVTAGHLPGGSK